MLADVPVGESPIGGSAANSRRCTLISLSSRRRCSRGIVSGEEGCGDQNQDSGSARMVEPHYHPKGQRASAACG
jgi:hypothetical protein